MLDRLAERIHDEVYQKFYDYKTTVFLCGAGTKASESVRGQIDRGLTTGRFSYRYDIVYPEDLFGELLFGPSHVDLMTLENILADSVDAIVIAIESYGAVAELGSFSSSSELRKKLVCVVDKERKKDKSFINYGPLRLLRDMHEGSIVYSDFADVSSIVDSIRTAIAKAKRTKTKMAHVKNVLQAHHFILPCIFLLQPVSRNTLIELVNHASGTNKRTSTALTAGALSILNKRREIELTPAGYKLTPAGMEHFKSLGRRGRTKQTFNLHAMDQLRVGILNWKYRGKPLRV